MDRRITNPLFGLQRSDISVTILWEDTLKECGSYLNTSALNVGLLKTRNPLSLSIHFLCQYPSLASCWYRLFGYPILVSLTELSFIDVKNIALFIKLSDWFSSIGQTCFQCAAFTLSNFFPRLWSLNGPLCVFK